MTYISYNGRKCIPFKKLCTRIALVALAALQAPRQFKTQKSKSKTLSDVYKFLVGVINFAKNSPRSMGDASASDTESNKPSPINEPYLELV